MRPLQESDAAAMAAATAQEQGTYVAWGPVPGPIDEARAIAFVREFGLASKKGLKTAFAVLDGHGDLVGSALLITSAPGQAELAYWVRATSRGRGHATRALTLTADWARELGFHHLWLEVEPGNQASQRVACKAGFHLSERRLCGIGGARVECLIYVRRDGNPAAPILPALPSGYALRRPTLDDLDAVLALLHAAEVEDRGQPNTSRGDLLADWKGLPNFELGQDAWLVTGEDERPVAYAWECNELAHELLVADHTVLPGHRDLGLEDYLMDLIEARAGQHAAANAAGRARLGVLSLDSAPTRLELFRRRGFARIRTFEHMTVSLDDPLEQPCWPGGIEVRTFRRGQDEEATHAATQEAFSEHFREAPLTLAQWKRLVFANPELDDSLWLVSCHLKTSITPRACGASGL